MTAGFRALVEENVKRSADLIYADPIIQELYKQYAAAADVSVCRRRKIKCGTPQGDEKSCP